MKSGFGMATAWVLPRFGVLLLSSMNGSFARAPRSKEHTLSAPINK